MEKFKDKINNILNEDVSPKRINQAINDRKKVFITYTHDDGIKRSREIEIYAYGLSKAGNPVIRAFQTAGKTATVKPGWKLFRVDRINSFRLLKTFSGFDEEPARRYVGSFIGGFNPLTDKSMSKVFNIVNLGDGNNNTPQTPNNTNQSNNVTDLDKNQVNQQKNEPTTNNNNQEIDNKKVIDISDADKKPINKSEFEQELNNRLNNNNQNDIEKESDI